MSTISIGYAVPVQVIVDTDTSTVARVIVIDEDVRPDRAGYIEDRYTYRTPAPADVDRAYEVAESSPWPTWDIGW